MLLLESLRNAVGGQSYLQNADRQRRPEGQRVDPAERHHERDGLLLDPEHDLAIGESSVILLALTLHRY